jgi:hypothetical protein
MSRFLCSSLLVVSLIGSVIGQGNPPYLPNPKLTPGETRNVTKDKLCDSAYRQIDDSIPVALKEQVFRRYAVRLDSPGGHNVDHLIPAMLGGTNTLKNLWPQPLSGEWQYQQKNRLERHLYRLVCKGELELSAAQKEIATDWVSSFKKHFSDAKQ